MEPALVIPVADLDDGPRSVRFDLTETWLAAALESTEAAPSGPGSLEVELLKNGKQVMVRGHADLVVTMACVRTLAPVNVSLRPEIFLMLSEASRAEGAQRRERKARRKKGRLHTAPAAAKAPKKGHRPWQDDPELSDEAAAHDTYDSEKVVLDRFVREFILLDLPMSPMVSDLPPEDKAAIPPAPASEALGQDRPLDPRLAPLAAIAKRLREQKK